MSHLTLIAQRRQIRQQRRQLTAGYRQQAGRKVMQRLQYQSVFKSAKHVGVYLSAFGEVLTQPIIDACFKRHKAVYLPQIRNFDQKLVWVKINRKQWQNRRFSSHKLGMHEPRQRGVSVNRLDLLLMPLLMFDLSGSRVGMGGGFYDRTLWKKRKAYRLGLAYDFQQVVHLQRQPWDQALQAVITPSRAHRFGCISPS